MRILYDYQAFEMQTFGGISKCFCKLITNLPNTCHVQIGIKESNNIHLHESKLIKDLAYCKIDSSNFITKKSFKGKIRLYNLFNSILPFYPTSYNINKHYSIKLLQARNYDIFHPTFFDDYFIKYLNQKPFVLTIHDMMPELFPQYYRKNDPQIIKKKYLAKRATAIVAVSEQTKKDIIKFLNVPEKKVTVIYHGGPEIYHPNNANSSPIIDAPFFLYVGQRNASKNFLQLVKDFSTFSKMNSKFKLICTGKCFTSEEIDYINKYNIKDKVIHITVNDKELRILYAQATALIYPSLYEGFGMPILEAYAYGCPVLLNNTSCFPEIAGNAAIYFTSNKNYSNITEKLSEISNYNKEERKNLIEKGYQQLNKYSWNKASNKLYQLYCSII